MKILILNHAEVETLLSVEACLSVMTDALTALAIGQAYQPLRSVIRPPDAAGFMGLMPAYMSVKQAGYGLKATCVFPENPAKGKDAHQGAVMLFSTKTGELLAVVNASTITAIRTAAVSGVATRLLAREDASELAIIGSGVQACSHLEAMVCVRPIKRVRVASLTLELAQDYATKMTSIYSFPIEPVESAEDAVRGSDIVVTVTTAVTPILKRDWLSPGTHINAVGSSFHNAREIDAATMADSTLFVDRRESTLKEAGDYLLAVQEGVFGPDHIQAELGEVLIGAKPGRTSFEEITLFESLGLGVEDLAATEYLYRKAMEKNVGTWVDF